jgi:GT2 family glycosyltransferase
MISTRQTSTGMGTSAPARPAVAAVVLNYNGLADTIDCVQSLKRSMYANLKIILVDNASTDGSQTSLPTRFPDVPLIVQPSNTGYAAGNNAGIRLALEQGARYILILNNDVIVAPDMLSVMVEKAEQRVQVGIVSGLVFYPGTPADVFSAGGHFSKWLCAGMNTGIVRHREGQEWVECDVTYACGALQLVRREVFESVGLLDERFFMYFEDLEFSRRVLKKFIISFTPRATACHKSGGGKGWRSYTELYLYFYTRNRFLVFASDPLVYRIYVAAYAALNAIAKTCVLSLNLRRDSTRTRRQLKALWAGYRDGLFLRTGKDGRRVDNEPPGIHR